MMAKGLQKVGKTHRVIDGKHFGSSVAFILLATTIIIQTLAPFCRIGSNLRFFFASILNREIVRISKKITAWNPSLEI